MSVCFTLNHKLNLILDELNKGLNNVQFILTDTN